MLKGAWMGTWGKRAWVWHNLVALRGKAGFPMIGKYFSNGWKIRVGFPMIGKIFRAFSNDWKKFSAQGKRKWKTQRG
jgi:hypothetical protein